MSLSLYREHSVRVVYMYTSLSGTVHNASSCNKIPVPKPKLYHFP